MGAGYVIWLDLVRAFSAIVSTMAVAFAAGFSYLKFVRGRLHHSQLNLDLGVNFVDVASDSALLIVATVTNAGTLRVEFPDDTGQPLTLRLADKALWDDAKRESHKEVLWTASIPCYQQELLVTEGRRETDPDGRNPFLEPTESFSRTLLVPIPEGDWRAYQIDLRVTASSSRLLRPKQTDTWKTELIAVKGPADGY